MALLLSFHALQRVGCAKGLGVTQARLCRYGREVRYLWPSSSGSYALSSLSIAQRCEDRKGQRSLDRVHLYRPAHRLAMQWREVGHRCWAPRYAQSGNDAA